MTYNAKYHNPSNNTDVCDAIVDGLGPWTAAGSIVGDNSAEPRKYVFIGLADDTEYTVRVRAGAEPAETDIVVATIEPDVVSGGSGGGGSLIGPGSILTPVTITKLGQPVDGAAVWVSTDPDGLNVIAGTLYTNTFGEVVPEFMLDAGVYYVWVQKGGVNFTNPSIVSVP